MARKPLSAGLEGWFTEEAAEAIGKLIEKGMDFDLAVAVLEVNWDEKRIYYIPGDEDRGEDRED